MAICKSYENLTIVEKRIFIGTLTHLAQTYEPIFQQFKRIIEKHELAGVLDGITILPNKNDNDVDKETD